MPHYRIYRIKNGPQESFRWAAHTGGLAVVKLKDYEPDRHIEAGNPYQAWKLMLSAGCPLRPGDLLQALPSASGEATDSGELLIAKYIGFEPAEWFIPEPKPALDLPPAAEAPRLPAQQMQDPRS